MRIPAILALAFSRLAFGDALVYNQPWYRRFSEFSLRSL